MRNNVLLLSWFGLMLLFALGCSRSYQVSQVVVYIHTTNGKSAFDIGNIIEKVMLRKGFSGSAPHSEKDVSWRQNAWTDGIYKRNQDDSYLTFDNRMRRDCLHVSIYSGEGKDDALKILEDVKSEIMVALPQANWSFHLDKCPNTNNSR